MTAKLRDDNHAEADRVAPISRRVVAAISNAAVKRIAEPRTAPKYLGVPYWRWPSGVCLGCVAIIAILVAAPLPYIAAHIVYAQFVAAFFSYGARSVAAIGIVPRYVTQTTATCVFVVLAVSSASCGIFPLGFGGQAKFAGGCLRIVAQKSVQLITKTIGIVPVNLFYGVVVAPAEMAGVVALNCSPLFLCDGVFAHIEGR